MNDLAGQFATIRKNLTLLTQQQIAALAVRVNAQIMSTAPVPLGVARHVDGVKDAPETAVKPDGVIVYDYNRLDQVVEFALNTLRDLSPVDTGNYVRSHIIMLNGEKVEDLRGWKPGDVIMISNTEPYTRKIEIGRKGFSAHPHVYERAYRIVFRRFGNVANINFGYESQVLPYIAGGSNRAERAALRNHPAKLSAMRLERATRYPTLTITEYK